MKLFLLPLMAFAMLALTPDALAQRGSPDRPGVSNPDMVWYAVKIGDRTETVRARNIRVHTERGRRFVMADRQRYAADEEIIIVIIPTEDTERPTGDLVRASMTGRSPWIFHQPPMSAQNESGSTTTTTTSTSPDGKYETTTTTTTTPSSDGGPPTTSSSTTIRGTGK